MFNNFKIPTVLGLGLLIVGLIVGVFLVSQRQTLLLRANINAVPKDIALANLTDTSASISWQTDISAPGFISYGPVVLLGLTAKDDRDLSAPQNHRLHLVTLTNLKPNTTYYYQISSGSIKSPSNPGTFTTLNTTQPMSLQPLIGKVIDPSLQPTEEALISLNIAGSKPLTTITKAAGNFVLPLSLLKTNEGSNFDLTKPSSGSLTITGEQLASTVSLTLPFSSFTLPTVILGQDLDITKTPTASTSSATNKYDINHDGVVNTFDYQLVLANIGKSIFREADLNLDGIVDKKDLELLSNYLKSPSGG